MSSCDVCCCLVVFAVDLVGGEVLCVEQLVVKVLVTSLALLLLFDLYSRVS